MPVNEEVVYNNDDPAWAGNMALITANEELEAAMKDLLVPAKK